MEIDVDTSGKVMRLEDLTDVESSPECGSKGKKGYGIQKGGKGEKRKRARFSDEWKAKKQATIYSRTEDTDVPEVKESQEVKATKPEVEMKEQAPTAAATATATGIQNCYVTLGLYSLSGKTSYRQILQVLNPRDWMLQWSNHSEIWQASWQHCCRGACKF